MPQSKMTSFAGSELLLGPKHQKELREEHSGYALSDCDPYHWFDLPNGKTFRGTWDLRESWPAYLGNVNFRGKRVLEVGPACGFLSLKMESEGAQVVSFDVAPDRIQDIISPPGEPLEKWRRDSITRIARFRKTWWYFHSLFGSSNQAVYGNVYDLPSGLGKFHAAVFASVLLHLSNPYEALRQAAAIADEVIVTELNSEAIAHAPLLQFFPSAQEPWQFWLISPMAIKTMLQSLGFANTTLTFHSHRHYPDDNTEMRLIKMYTVVATRTS
jgi:hypothetical protein